MNISDDYINLTEIIRLFMLKYVLFDKKVMGCPILSHKMKCIIIIFKHYCVILWMILDQSKEQEKLKSSVL